MERHRLMNRMFSAATGLVVAGALLATAANDAQAAFKLKLDDGVNAPVVVVGAGGIAAFNGTIGVWGVNFTTGLTDPILSPPFPHLNLNSMNVSSGGAGTLTVMLTDTDFSLTAASTREFTSMISGVTAGTVDFEAYVNLDNGEFSTTGTKVADLGPFGPGAFATTAFADAGTGPGYSVTLVATFAHTGGGQSTQFGSDFQVAVPEPGSLALFGLGLLGLGFLWRRHLRRDWAA